MTVAPAWDTNDKKTVTRELVAVDDNGGLVLRSAKGTYGFMSKTLEGNYVMASGSGLGFRSYVVDASTITFTVTPEGTELVGQYRDPGWDVYMAWYNGQNYGAQQRLRNAARTALNVEALTSGSEEGIGSSDVSCEAQSIFVSWLYSDVVSFDEYLSRVEKDNADELAFYERYNG